MYSHANTVLLRKCQLEQRAFAGHGVRFRNCFGAGVAQLVHSYILVRRRKIACLPPRRGWGLTTGARSQSMDSSMLAAIFKHFVLNAVSDFLEPQKRRPF